MVNKTYPFVTIVIPIIGYKNIPHYLLKSIIAIKYPKEKFEVIFVKLRSQPIKFSLPGIKTIVVNSGKIIGYSEAVNVGAKKAKRELIFLINPDIRLDRNSLIELVDYYSINPAVGVTGPVVFTLGSPNNLSPYDLPVRFNKQFGRMTPLSTKKIKSLKSPYEVDWLSGCALLFSKDVWSKLDGFEEKLFIYWEDADFCMRAKEKGLHIVLIPSARVWHQGSAYMKSQNSKLYYLVRNVNFFSHRHTGLLGKIFLHGNNLLLIIIKILRFVLQPAKRQESYVYLCGVFDFYRGRMGKKA
ncbi:MAG: glycosyltransferase family 2 protein [Candidatus Levybacteria bacterium]|nr:glycosyltransferase family 2 protein [Candidatus Levybacteria bacterium]